MIKQDDNGDAESFTERSFKRAVESVSLLTALSFLISAGLNALDFWYRFDLNFFAIAQPSDIVMSGFLYVSFVVGLALAVVVGILVSKKIPKWLIGLGMNYFAQTLDKDRRAFAESLLLLAYSFANLITSGVFIYLLLSNPIDLSSLKNGDTRAQNDLYLSPSDDQASACGLSPVLWMGSGSVILNCAGRIRIVHNTQALLVERYTPAEIAATKRDVGRKISVEKPLPTLAAPVAVKGAGQPKGVLPLRPPSTSRQ